LFSFDEMGMETIEAAKKIVSKRVMQFSENQEINLSNFACQMRRIEDKLAKLEGFELKLEELLFKLK